MAALDAVQSRRFDTCRTHLTGWQPVTESSRRKAAIWIPWKNRSGHTSYRVCGWSTGFEQFFKAKSCNTVYESQNRRAAAMQRIRAPPTRKRGGT